MNGGAIVLCGGLSSRMGRPKALLPWRGRPMIAHVVSVLREAVDDVVVVTSTELELPTLDARVVTDREPKLGPLGGIREGLHATRSDSAFVTSTDAPFLTAAFVRAMLAFGVTAAPDVDGFVQSMSAVYAASLATKADELIGAGRMRPLFLLEAGAFRRVAAAEVPDVSSVRNLNTAADYLQALEADGQRAPAIVEFLGTAREKRGAAAEIAPGMLGDLLKRFSIGEHHLVSLNGRQFTRKDDVPVGPGDRVIVMDAAAGG